MRDLDCLLRRLRRIHLIKWREFHVMKVQSNGKTVEYHLPDDDVRGAILHHATLAWHI